ncbi:MAG: MATE family efflux transporter [Lachnospiraceae bacterium]|nr:MATE family efflux transporter [Lachnospiraceae bacterium]MBD5512721.1 MATE family efflux transporter [Lachnospiraceae bacterium]
MKQENNAKQNMLTGNPGKTLFFFALPMILGNLFQQFYNMADSMIVGQYVGEDALAAVGASYSLTTVFIMVAIGGGIGASVITSQYLGAQSYGKMKTSIYTALINFLIISVLLAAGGFLLNRNILTALKTPDNIIDDAVLYLEIYFCGLPFLFMYNILSAMFNALGKSKIPLGLLIFSSVLNVALDLYMVRVLEWGVAGVAIATVIAQGISALISFGILLWILKRYKAEERAKLYDVEMLVRGTKIAIPSIVQQSIVSIGMLLVQSVVNGFGSSVLAGYSAGMRIESICIVPMIATGNAVSTFTAQNLGAGQPERVKKGYHAGLAMIAVFAVIICIILQVFHGSIIDAFLKGDGGMDAYQTGNDYLTFIGWFFALIGVKACTDGVLRGAGDVNVYMVANLVNLAFRVSFANLCAPVFGVQAVWWAVPIGWGVNFLLSFIWYRTGRWSRKRVI